MCKHDKENLLFNLHTFCDKDKEAYDRMLRLIFNYTTYNKKEGVYILDLITKNRYEKLLEEYFISIGDRKKISIFYTAVESNCIELVKFMINIKINIQPHQIMELIDTARICKYPEMLKLLKESFSEIE